MNAYRIRVQRYADGVIRARIGGRQVFISVSVPENKVSKDSVRVAVKDLAGRQLPLALWEAGQARTVKGDPRDGQ